MPDGTEVSLFTLQQDAVRVRITQFGARIVSIETPDRNGDVADIVLGYNSLAEYTADKKTYFGAIIGRYANRIGGGTFLLDGTRYRLPINDSGNSLHGGTVGFDQHVWTAQPIPHGVELTLISLNGDQGYPGTLTTRVRYTLQGETLRIEYFATTDRPTVLNLTNHTYFNLAGEGHGDILGHVLSLAADRYTPVDAGLIPTGQIAPVAGTPFEFERPTVIGDRIHRPNEQLQFAKGYDQNYVLQRESVPQREPGIALSGHGSLAPAAHLFEPSSGRTLELTTTQPGIQFYSGNFLDGAFRGKRGKPYNKHAGLCLETQHFPDSPNHPKFPSTRLTPGETFHSTTEYGFSTEK